MCLAFELIFSGSFYEAIRFMFQAIITCSFSSVVILADRSPDLSNKLRVGGISFLVSHR